MKTTSQDSPKTAAARSWRRWLHWAAQLWDYLQKSSMDVRHFPS